MVVPGGVRSGGMLCLQRTSCRASLRGRELRGCGGMLWLAGRGSVGVSVAGRVGVGGAATGCECVSVLVSVS